MARGRKTDLVLAATVRVMAEMGFEVRLIAKLLKIPRSTATDITHARDSWSYQVDNELTLTVKYRVKQAIENVADDLAMKAIARLEEKIEKASIIELCSILNVLGRIGG